VIACACPQQRWEGQSTGLAKLEQPILAPSRRAPFANFRSPVLPILTFYSKSTLASSNYCAPLNPLFC
jgi:hypothetical protein